MSLIDFLKVAENDFSSIAQDGVTGDISNWVDTGSYTLNALVSGSIFKRTSR